MNFLISLLLSSLLAGLALIKKSMTVPGLILAFICSILISKFGGLECFFILVVVFLGTLIAGKIKKEKRLKINSSTILKEGKKDFFQIVANVGLGTFSIILYVIYKDFIFLITYAAIMTESLSDSLASDIGVLSNSKPFNIITFKRSEPGLSGNVSFLGLLASFIGALIIALIFFSFHPSLSNMVVITVSGFVGAIIDSYLGALFQVKYRCIKCGKITERRAHCNEDATYYSGIKFINNDVVNFLGNLFSFGLSLILLVIFNKI